jgi:hypothetical protein
MVTALSPVPSVRVFSGAATSASRCPWRLLPERCGSMSPFHRGKLPLSSLMEIPDEITGAEDDDDEAARELIVVESCIAEVPIAAAARRNSSGGGGCGSRRRRLGRLERRL